MCWPVIHLINPHPQSRRRSGWVFCSLCSKWWSNYRHVAVLNAPPADYSWNKFKREVPRMWHSKWSSKRLLGLSSSSPLNIITTHYLPPSCDPSCLDHHEACNSSRNHCNHDTMTWWAQTEREIILLPLHLIRRLSTTRGRNRKGMETSRTMVEGGTGEVSFIYITFGPQRVSWESEKFINFNCAKN